MNYRAARLVIVVIALATTSTNVLAGGENYPIGARSAAMGNASTMLSDLWAVHHNQAGLAGLTSPVAGIHYENRFSLQELSLKAAAFALPLAGDGHSVIGLSMVSFGYSAYSDMKVGLAFGKQLGDKYSVGLQLDYLQTSIGNEYGRKGAVAADEELAAGNGDAGTDEIIPLLAHRCTMQNLAFLCVQHKHLTPVVLQIDFSIGAGG